MIYYVYTIRSTYIVSMIFNNLKRSKSLCDFISVCSFSRSVFECAIDINLSVISPIDFTTNFFLAHTVQCACNKKVKNIKLENEIVCHLKNKDEDVHR